MSYDFPLQNARPEPALASGVGGVPLDVDAIGAAVAAAPDAVLSLRLRLLAQGYHPVPLLTGEKHPTMDAWQVQTLIATERMHRRWIIGFRNCLNTGIACSGLRVVDIDCDDSEIAGKIRDLALRMLGPAPERYRDGTPRSALVYRADFGTPHKVDRKSRSLKNEDGKAVKVEVLGDGQQLHSHGLHPSGAELRWRFDEFPMDGPGPRDALPAVSQQQVSAFLAAVAEIIDADPHGSHAATSTTRSAGTGTSSAENLKAAPSKAARVALVKIMRALPNDSPFDDRGRWIALAHALAAAFADYPEVARRLWLEFCGKRAQAEGEPERVWDTLAPPHTVGAAWVVDRAREAATRGKAAGFDVSALADAVAAYEAAAHAARLTQAQAEFQAGTDTPDDPPPGTPAPSDPALGPCGDDDKVSLRDKALIAMQGAGARFWRDADSNGYLTIPCQNAPQSGAVERHRIKTRAVALMIRKVYGAANTRVIGGQAMPGSLPDSVVGEVQNELETKAAFSNAVREPAVRVCGTADGAVWIDLGRPDWSAVKVTADGWRVMPRANAPLVRPAGLRSLPVPVRDPEALGKLRGLLNLPQSDTDDAFMLAVSWLVMVFYPHGPYPLVALDGEQGSGKSTVCRMLRRLADPNQAELRATPRSEDDLLIAATNSRILALDNMSHITPDLADALCRVLTGAGYGKRSLYTNGEEHLGSVCRPAIINGIPDLLARPDLADRALAFTLPMIPTAARRDEDAVWRAFDAAAPGILGAVLDGLATALRNLPTLKLGELPRMADFAKVGCAAAPAFGWTPDAVLKAINQNRARVAASVLAANPLAEAVRAFAAGIGQPEAENTWGEAPKPGTWTADSWSGTASQLLKLLDGHVSLDERKARNWPKDGIRLSRALRRLAPALRSDDIDIDMPEPKAGGHNPRIITVKRLPPKAETPET